MTDRTAVDDCLLHIDNQCDPCKMSKEEAADFILDIIEGLRSRVECLREEIANETGKD